MAYKRKRNFKPRANKRRKRYGRRMTRVTVPKRTINVPDRALVSLKYCDSAIITNVVAGTPDFIFFQANNAYQPNPLGGHKPMGFDDWNTKYHHWRVIASKIIIKAQMDDEPDLNADQFPCVTLTRTNTKSLDPALIPTIFQAQEQKGTKCTVLAPGNKTSHMSMGYSPKKTYGALASDKDQYGNATSGPAEHAWYRIGNVPQNGSSQAKKVYLHVTLYYKLMFVERKMQELD